MICKRYSQHLQPMRERPSNFDFGLLPCHILDLVHHAKTRNSRHSLYPTPTRKTDLNVDVLLTLLAGFIGFPWGLTGSEPVHARRAKLQNPLYPSVFQRESSGRGGIRTHGWFNPTFDFESSALNRTQPPFLLSRIEGTISPSLRQARKKWGVHSFKISFHGFHESASVIRTSS
jgi:hypothetical protein